MCVCACVLFIQLGQPSVALLVKAADLNDHHRDEGALRQFTLYFEPQQYCRSFKQHYSSYYCFAAFVFLPHHY